MTNTTEVIAFDGTLQGLCDQLDLLRATMPKCPAFILDAGGETLNRLRVHVKKLTDGSEVWDVSLVPQAPAKVWPGKERPCT